MPKDNDEELKFNRDEYKTTSNNLQNYMLIFLSFLFFVSFFILYPYYFLADSYKAAKNIEFLTDETNKNLSSIQKTLTDLAKNPNYQNSLREINSNFSEHFQNLSQSRESCENIRITPPNNEINFKNDNTITSKSDDCSVIDSKISNLEKYRSNQLNEKFITINSSSFDSIKDKIPILQKMVKNISDNNIKYKAINDSNLVNVKNWISTLNSNISEFESPNRANKLTLAEFQKFFLITANAISPIAYNVELLQKKIAEFNDRIESIEFPIIGKVPFDLNQLLLSFPVVIAVGFSFISLQYKRLIEAHKEFGNAKYAAVLSWIDPVQAFPEKAYAIIIIALPGILFLVFIFFINIILYTNIQYHQESSLVAEDFLIIPEYIKNSLQYLNLFGVIMLILSYYQIVKAWRGLSN